MEDNINVSLLLFAGNMLIKMTDISKASPAIAIFFVVKPFFQIK